MKRASTHHHPPQDMVGLWEPSYQRPAALPSDLGHFLRSQKAGGDLFIRKSLSSQQPFQLVDVGELGSWVLAQQERLKTVFLLPCRVLKF